MVKLVNRAKMTTATTGTGTITLGSAVDGFQTFDAAGVSDADVVRYVIEDGTAWEIGTGTYSSSGGNLTRTPSESSIGGGAITLSGDATVFIGAEEADLRVERVGVVTGSTLDLSTGTVFLSTPSSNITYAFDNPPASGTAYGFTLRVAPSDTITVDWPASVKWPDGLAPLAPASGETSVYVFYTQDGGTTYFGFVAGEDMS